MTAPSSPPDPGGLPGQGAPPSWAGSRPRTPARPVSGFSETFPVAPGGLRHGLRVHIVTPRPGASIPVEESHATGDGSVVPRGEAVDRIGRGRAENEAGDARGPRASRPQACDAGGPGPFRDPPSEEADRHADPGRGRGGAR